MKLFSHKMVIVALAAGFCGFLLRSAAAPWLGAVPAPAITLSAVAATTARPPEEIISAFDAWEDRLLDTVDEGAAAAPVPEDAAPAEIIALPGADEPAPAVAIHYHPTPLPSLAENPLPQEAVMETASLPLAFTAAVAPAPRPARVAPARRFREVWAVVTAYCPCTRCCGARARGRTSIGGSAWLPGIAADPQALAYGTTVFVPGYGEATVDDTGGAMRRSWRQGRLHLDIRMKYHGEARRWGRKTMKVRVYR